MVEIVWHAVLGIASFAFGYLLGAVQTEWENRR